MNNADSVITDLTMNVAMGLIPILILMSLTMTLAIIIRNTSLKDVKHFSYNKWLSLVLLLFAVNLVILFSAYYLFGYVLEAQLSDSIIVWYVPAIFILQGIIQKLLLNQLVKPKDLADNKENRNKKFGYALGATIPVVFIALLDIIDLDPNSNAIYFIAPLLIALPLILIYIYTMKINK